MSIFNKIKTKTISKTSAKWIKVSELFMKRYRGFPVGVIVGIVIVVAASAYAAPMIINSSNTSNKTVSKQTASNNKSDNPATNSVTSHTNKPSSKTSTSSQSSGTPSSSGKTASSTSTQPAPQKPAPTMTGIAVISPTPGANETIYIPYCEFGDIISGTPETCYDYTPIPFNLVAEYSDGSTSPLSWSAATVSSLNPLGSSYPDIPMLLNIDDANNTLLLGTAPQYFLNDHTSDAVVTIDVTYQQWTYTKYVHIYVNSTWGNP
ncbi:MAG TPA: hypothetical protein VL989_01520 [Candidatus Sulfotelmatobacter sp.]|nr:hypothetical protein [Candidatus Sulfotelmatobacter sp.]